MSTDDAFEAYAGAYQGLSHGVTLPGEEPIAERGQGCYIETASGERYVDYMLGSGAIIAGHAHPHIRDAIQSQAERGSNFILPADSSIELARRLGDAIPCAERVIFTCTGSQGVFFAIRLARAFTGNDKILKFEGAYHGYHDAVLKGTNWGPREDLWELEPPEGTVDSAGIPNTTIDQTLVSRFNDLDLTESIVREHGEDLAAIIVEPVHRSLPPEDDFLRGLRELCNAHDVLLIFDEIVTGFRIALGGAQERYGVTPDLATYGKTMTGGTPIGAVCGRQDIVELAGPRVSVEDSGCLVGSTHNGNPICAAAANATLDLLAEDGVYAQFDAYADRFRQFVIEALDAYGVPAIPLGEGGIIDYAITDEDVTDWRSSLHTDVDLKREIEREVVEQGVLMFTGAKKYISLSHDDEAFERTKEAYQTSFEQHLG